MITGPDAISRFVNVLIVIEVDFLLPEGTDAKVVTSFIKTAVLSRFRA